MTVLIAIALKSLLVAGATLGLLALMKRRSAAERSWVAHIGLLALVIMAVAPLALPSWNIEAPAIMGEAATGNPAITSPAAATPATVGPQAPAATWPVIAESPAINAAAAVTAAYAVPAAILLLITFLALARLVTLRARADVLVDGHWLSALARAQRRMGFKHGTALLTSDELASPISWGLMRPVILLNTKAVEASAEAEAIIAHELAHVARMDWVKLLLARIATALFWFNPLVWLLAREAHQLREETADDAVLASDIADTDYAQLLVGVARHECPGLLLGAHGVAPSKSSLARRVARVLDGKLVRGPVQRGFALGILTGAVLVAAPLAALNLTPARPAQAKLAAAATPVTSATASIAAVDTSSPYYPQEADVPTDLPSIIADGVSTAVAAVAPVVAMHEEDSWESSLELAGEQRERALEAAARVREEGQRARDAGHRARDAAQRARDAGHRARDAAQRARDAAQRARDAGQRARQHSAIDLAVQFKAIGVTPEYIAALRASSPRLRNAETEEFIGLKALGVTPDYVRTLATMGYGNLDADEIQQARAIGLTPGYVRSIRATGVRPTFDELVELRAMNISADELARVRASGASTKERIREFASPRRSAVEPPDDDHDDGT